MALAFPLSDVQLQLQRFPSEVTCQKAVEANWACQKHLKTAAPLHPERAEAYAQAIRECTWAETAWIDLECAWQGIHLEEEVGLSASGCLEDLKKWIGEEAFWQGAMPCPIPRWAVGD